MRIVHRTTGLILLGVLLSLVPIVGVPNGQASADSVPYEMYCPGTPVGNIVLNGTTSSGILTPAIPSQGHRFGITGYTVTFVLPAAIASAAEALGNTSIAMTLKTAFIVSGGRPALKRFHRQNIDVSLPVNVPDNGLVVAVHFPSMTVGRVRRRATQITISQYPHVRLTMNVSGSILGLRCLTYPNDSAPSGIVNSSPSGSPVAPVIATGP